MATDDMDFEDEDMGLGTSAFQTPLKRSIDDEIASSVPSASASMVCGGAAAAAASASSGAPAAAVEKPMPPPAGGPKRVKADPARRCEGCLGFGKSFKAHAPHCTECQPTLDAAEKDARKNGWIEQYRAEVKIPRTRRRLIQRFQTQCPSRGRGACRAPFDHMQYFELHYADTEIERRAHCVKMDEDDFRRYHKEKGKKTVAEVTAEWEALVARYEANPNDPTLEWDKKDGELRFAIHVDDVVDYVNRTGQRKRYMLNDKQKKNPTEDDVNRAHARTVTGHQGFMGRNLHDRGGSAMPAANPLGPGGLFHAGGDLGMVVSPPAKGAGDSAGCPSDAGSVEKAKKEKAVDVDKTLAAYAQLTESIKVGRAKWQKTLDSVQEARAHCVENKDDEIIKQYGKIMEAKEAVARIVFARETTPTDATTNLKEHIESLDYVERRLLQYAEPAAYPLSCVLDDMAKEMLSASTNLQMDDCKDKVKEVINSLTKVSNGLAKVVSEKHDQ